MGKLKITIKRKTANIDLTSVFRDTFPVPINKKKLSNNFGIVTACSENLFVGLQMLITSISYYYDIVILVWDIGLTLEQISWCKRQPKVMVKSFSFPDYKDHIKYAGAWFKPHYIIGSPFRNTIWIDADTVVVGDLQELIDWSHPQALFTSDHTQLKETTLNQPQLYSFLPTGKLYCDSPPYLNSGVMIVNKKRDENILNDWRYCVEQACVTKEIANSISCWDQGALKWSLHKNNKLFLITHDKKFNYPANIRHLSYPRTPEAIAYLIKNSMPKDPCIILHWMGSPKPWNNWDNKIDLDLSRK